MNGRSTHKKWPWLVIAACLSPFLIVPPLVDSMSEKSAQADTAPTPPAANKAYYPNECPPCFPIELTAMDLFVYEHLDWIQIEWAKDYDGPTYQAWIDQMWEELDQKDREIEGLRQDLGRETMLRVLCEDGKLSSQLPRDLVAREDQMARNSCGAYCTPADHKLIRVMASAGNPVLTAHGFAPSDLPASASNPREDRPKAPENDCPPNCSQNGTCGCCGDQLAGCF